VRSLNVTLGSQVRANQVLIVLSADEIEAKANQARAQLAQAGIELKRAQLLRDSRSIPAAQYDSALAQHAVAEATLAEADVLRGYTTIRAPFAGVITAKHCDVGDLAMPGKPLLVLESPGALRFEASVPETVAAAVQAGAVMQVHIDALRRGLSARVSELSPSADPASRTVSVKLDLPSIAGLRAGMFGRLSVPTGEERALVVPSAALVQRGQMEMLFVVERGRAHLRLVRSGRIHDGQTEVLAGLARGEPVIVAEAHHLSDADLVEVLP
jgi:RND family efflux transporter MFP subunit